MTAAQGTRRKTQVSSLSHRSRVLSLPDGFSLVEIIIALSILGIGLIGAMRVFPVGLRASQRSELRSRAAFIAQRAIETVKVSPWEQIKDGETRLEQKPFVVITTISPAEVERLADSFALKRVEVSIEWTQEGRPRSLTVATYVRRQA